MPGAVLRGVHKHPTHFALHLFASQKDPQVIVTPPRHPASRWFLPDCSLLPPTVLILLRCENSSNAQFAWAVMPLETSDKCLVRFWWSSRHTAVLQQYLNMSGSTMCVLFKPVQASIAIRRLISRTLGVLSCCDASMLPLAYPFSLATRYLMVILFCACSRENHSYRRVLVSHGLGREQLRFARHTRNVSVTHTRYARTDRQCARLSLSLM